MHGLEWTQRRSPLSGDDGGVAQERRSARGRV